MTNLKDYKLVYSITAIPNILFAGITTAAEPLSFDFEKFHIPVELTTGSTPIEVRIYLFGPDNNVIEMSSNILPASPSIICKTAELSGLKISKKILDKLNKNSN